MIVGLAAFAPVVIFAMIVFVSQVRKHNRIGLE